MLHNSTLMVNDLPHLMSGLPNGRAPCSSRSLLQQNIGEKVNIGSGLTAGKVAGFPHIRVLGSVAASKFVQNKYAR